MSDSTGNPAIQNPELSDSDRKRAIESPKLSDSPEVDGEKKIPWAEIRAKCAESGFSASAAQKIKILYDRTKTGQAFKTTDAARWIGAAPATARRLIARLRETGAIVPVSGRGKGVYRFKTKNEL